jgi:transcriptional regulator with XRE-family HTH domain
MRKKMKKTKQTGKRGGSSLKKQIGQRFRKFRETIGKTQTQLAGEFKVYQSTITNIEVGKTFPGIKYLHQLGKTYRLNADWIVNDRREMFDDSPPFPKAMIEKYSNLIKLMQVPVVEQLILARLEEVKAIAREDIERFLALQTDTDSGTTS